jgi:acetyl-CoA carboxylase biotin carboxyl carrier protein
MSAGHLDASVLGELRQQARQVIAETAGPLRRVHLRHGEVAVEIEWHLPAATESAPPRPAPPATRPADGPDDGRHRVTAPVVGTWYRAPEPGASPFVGVGDRVDAGQVVGVVEAMKLMNEVRADRSGTVAELLVADGDPVEFGQPLIILQA